MKHKNIFILVFALSIIFSIKFRVLAFEDEILKTKYPDYKLEYSLNNVPIDKKFVIHFSEDIKSECVNNECIELLDSSLQNKVPIYFNYLDKKDIQVVPKDNLAYGQVYYLIVNNFAKSINNEEIKNGVICKVMVKNQNEIVPIPSTNTPTTLLDSQKDFIQKISYGAKQTYYKYKVFPSVTIAQAILESAWGTSDKAIECNNLFGIKADKSWTGSKKDFPTKEWVDGKVVNIVTGWRVYSSIEDSIEDHGKFLYSRPWYAKAGVFEAQNYKEQIQSIHNAGYATDPNYASKVCEIIEKYDLWKYDIDNNLY
ncbi:Exo-glucosaminidase LytG precursor [Clostridium acetireducens DSM 10703]|jgi:hypothetical protein|uniref:Exo-glucosaminidase LytG n=1 Tax=Clostridium acetireducens DSM 10703 TaxID=1121290 RepID=A0A1E8EXG9_9CLOT|nr:glucosaminidase domain-containing protein [Clostridium acetireducens]OFI05494.1 Exo-glucosaminidase LytG precursor [Clostridium acetireducens DSM 10703]